MNRESLTQENYFWIGTVGHFALEDFHGHNIYGHPVEAAKACVDAHLKAERINKQNNRQFMHMPDDWKDQADLLYGILDHYVAWLVNRDSYQTYWYEGRPQVECVWRIPLTSEIPEELIEVFEIESIFYEVTFDRIAIDENGNYFVVDYKFYKSFRHEHLDFDQQASAYVWAGNCIYPDVSVSGFLLHQFRKDVPQPPELTSKGLITTNLQSLGSSTTYLLYKEALDMMYGSWRKAPPQHRRALGELADMEHETRDNFIRYDRTYRNLEQVRATGTKILMELQEMIDPNLPLYPNETKDCSWDCSFRDVCLMMDREEYWEEVLQETTVSRQEEKATWRQYLP